MEMPKIMKLTETLPLRGIGRSAHYLEVKKGVWTPPVRCGCRGAGWPEPEVKILSGARIAGKSDEDMREIVSDLLEARKM